MGRSQVSSRAIVGGALLLVVALTGSAVAQSPSPVPSAAASVAPSDAASSPSAPVALGPIKWKRVTKGKDFTTNPAAYRAGQLPDGRLVVLGSVGDETGWPSGAVWASADGSRWARLNLDAPEGSAIGAIATLDGTVVVTGSAGAGLEVAPGLVWTSADGTAWSAATLVGGQIYSLASIPGGLVGAGMLEEAATAWTTTDAVTWTPTTLAAEGRGQHIVAGPDGSLVIAGAVGSFLGGASRPAVWRSDDGGVTWTETVLDGLLPGFWSIPAAAVTPLGFVVTLVDDGQSGTSSRVWTSPDGVAWTESLDQEGGFWWQVRWAPTRSSSGTGRSCARPTVSPGPRRT